LNIHNTTKNIFNECEIFAIYAMMIKIQQNSEVNMILTLITRPII